MPHTIREAKSNLSNLIRLAEDGQPQTIRRHNTEVAVVVSIADWKRMKRQQESLVEFLRKSPLDEIIPYLDRPQDAPREVFFE